MIKKCTMATEPVAVEIRKISDTLYDVQIRCNVQNTTHKRKNRETGEIEDVPAYSFDLYTKTVEAATREMLISESIHVKYSVDDEIALIHKNAVDKDNSEYAEYQTLRTAIKARATELFEEAA